MMSPHVKCIVNNMENQNIPTNWKTTVMQGVLYWGEPVEESAVTQSIAKTVWLKVI